jgi:hypothetical protein
LFANWKNWRNVNPVQYYSEKRKDECLTHVGSSAMITDITSGKHCHAKLNTISCDGMYFETDRAIKPGNFIDIEFEKPPLKDGLKSFTAIVYWCMSISEDDAIRQYGVGVKFN